MILDSRRSGAAEAEQGGAPERVSEPVLNWNVTCARPVTLAVRCREVECFHS